MNKRTYIKCLIFSDGKKEEKLVKHKYSAAVPLTIGDVKNAAASYLRIEDGIAKASESDGEEVTLDDGEAYVPEDGIWIEFKGTPSISNTPPLSDILTSIVQSPMPNFDNDIDAFATPRTEDPPLQCFADDLSDGFNAKDNDTAAASSSSPPSCIYEKKGLKYKFANSDEYKTWSSINKEPVLSLYDSLKPFHDIILKKVNIFDFFNCDNYRGAIVLSKHPHVSGKSVSLCTQAQEMFFKGTSQLIAKAYMNEDLPYSELSAATKLLYDWLGLEFIQGWSNGSSTSRLGKVFRNRKWRKRKSDGTVPTAAAKKRKFSSYSDAFDIERLKKVSNEIKSAADFQEMDEMYKNSCNLRCQWYDTLNAHPDYDRGIVSAVLQKFPSLKTNILLLHYDYVCCMMAKYDRVPNIGTVLTTNASVIIAAAKEYKLCFSTTADPTLDALCVLPSLLQQFSSNAKKCTLSRLLLKSECEDTASLLLQKNDITTAPMLLLIQKDSTRTYYVATDDSALQLPYCNGAQALQALFEVHYTFNLNYDKCMVLLFEFLEWLDGFNKKPKALFTKLQEALRLIKEMKTTEPNASDVLASDRESEVAVSSVEDSTLQDEPHLMDLINATTPQSRKKKTPSCRNSNLTPTFSSKSATRQQDETPVLRRPLRTISSNSATPSSSRSSLRHLR